MLTALVQLRGSLQDVRLPLDAARRRRAAHGPAGDGRPARGLRHPAADDPRRAAARRGRRLHRRRQVDAGELPRRPPGHPARRAPADHALAGAGPPPRRRPVVRPGPPAARPRAGRRATNDPRRAPAGARPTRCPPGLAVLDAPDIDSVEEQNRTPRRAAARRGRPVAVRHLGRAVRRPGAVGLPAPGRRAQRRRRDRARPHARRRRSAPVSTHLARMLAARGLKDSPLFVVTEGKVDDDGLLPGRVGRRGARLARLARRRRRGPDHGRPADARGRDPHADPAYPRGRGRRDRAGRRRRAAARGRRPRPTTTRSSKVERGVRRRHAAARRGARPVAGVRRHRRAAARRSSSGSAGCATGS